jgi:hypothetical protein
MARPTALETCCRKDQVGHKDQGTDVQYLGVTMPRAGIYLPICFLNGFKSDLSRHFRCEENTNHQGNSGR